MAAYNNSNGHLLPPLLSLTPQRARCIFESSSTIESIQIRATPALAVLPILANQGKGDVEFSTNVVTLSTVLFIVVIPILQTLLG